MEKLTSRRNNVCIHVKKLGADRSYREKSGQYICDGIKLLEEAIKCNVTIDIVITAAGLPFPLPVNTRIYTAERTIIESISSLKSAQDTLFVCRMPPPQIKPGCAFVKGIHILLDSIQDPGNMGAIIRSANAFGIDSIILTGTFADPYNPKSLRASMGAIFRQSICCMEASRLAELKRSDGVMFIGTSADDRGRDITGADLFDAVIAVGNEGHGLSEEILALCDEMVTIPVSNGCESLNAAVAASVIMWEACGKGR